MVDFRPFRAIRYNPEIAGSMQTLVCPPYDVISPQQEQALLKRNPYNMVRLELTEIEGTPPPTRYEDAGRAFQKFLADRALVRDGEPGYYLLRQRFALSGATLERFGLFGALRLEELGEGVLPHEDTAAGPKADRLALMRQARANFSPIMGLYRDSSGQIKSAVHRTMATAPAFDFSGDDGQGYTLWLVKDAPSIAAIHQALAQHPIYIADGHHRYETALAYRGLQDGANGDAAQNFVMACLIDFDDSGLRNLPYHRVLHSLTPAEIARANELMTQHFRQQPLALHSVTPDALASLLSQEDSDLAIGLLDASRGSTTLLTNPPSPARQDVALTPEAAVRRVETWALQEQVFRPLLGDDFPAKVTYVHDGQRVLDMVRDGEAQLGFFLKGVPFHHFELVVGAGIRLPRKSTYFHPKLPSGLVINALEGAL